MPTRITTPYHTYPVHNSSPNRKLHPRTAQKPFHIRFAKGSRHHSPPPPPPSTSRSPPRPSGPTMDRLAPSKMHGYHIFNQTSRALTETHAKSAKNTHVLSLHGCSRGCSYRRLEMTGRCGTADQSAFQASDHANLESILPMSKAWENTKHTCYM